MTGTATGVGGAFFSAWGRWWSVTWLASCVVFACDSACLVSSRVQLHVSRLEPVAPSCAPRACAAPEVLHLVQNPGHEVLHLVQGAGSRGCPHNAETCSPLMMRQAPALCRFATVFYAKAVPFPRFGPATAFRMFETGLAGRAVANLRRREGPRRLSRAGCWPGRVRSNDCREVQSASVQGCLEIADIPSRAPIFVHLSWCRRAPPNEFEPTVYTIGLRLLTERDE